LIRAWRLTKRRHADTARTGEGGLYAPGRWHRQGLRVVYGAESLSLAALEVLVHLGRSDLNIDLVAIGIEIPDDVGIDRITVDTLPPHWRAEPPALATVELGSEWLERAAAAVLVVPSAIIRQEHNYVLNPAHPDFQRILFGEPEPFAFDPRLWI
jgi:RES domain-containing protein